MVQFKRTALGKALVGFGAVAALLSLASCTQSGQGQGAGANAPHASESASAAAPGGAPVAVSHATFSPFTGTVGATMANTQCSLDVINGQPAANAAGVATGATITFGGWAGNGRGQPEAHGVLVLKSAQQSYSAPLVLNVARPDVAKALNSAAMTQSGFNLSAALSGVAKGTYTIYIASPGNSASDCDTHHVLTVQ